VVFIVPVSPRERSSILQARDPVDARHWRTGAVIAVYGGQGTINVPSWSPDGKRLAFVSNTVIP
jgi:Tol biopolymer transport system component